jgi:hypothetical protein
VFAEVPGGKNERGAKSLFNEIVTETFSNLVKKVIIQTQGA